MAYLAHKKQKRIPIRIMKIRFHSETCLALIFRWLNFLLLLFYYIVFSGLLLFMILVVVGVSGACFSSMNYKSNFRLYFATIFLFCHTNNSGVHWYRLCGRCCYRYRWFSCRMRGSESSIHFHFPILAIVAQVCTAAIAEQNVPHRHTVLQSTP